MSIDYYCSLNGNGLFLCLLGSPHTSLNCQMYARPAVRCTIDTKNTVGCSSVKAFVVKAPNKIDLIAVQVTMNMITVHFPIFALVTATIGTDRDIASSPFHTRCDDISYRLPPSLTLLNS